MFKFFINSIKSITVIFLSVVIVVYKYKIQKIWKKHTKNDLFFCIFFYHILSLSKEFVDINESTTRRK